MMIWLVFGSKIFGNICLPIGVRNPVEESDNFPTLAEADLHIDHMLFCLRFWNFQDILHT